MIKPGQLVKLHSHSDYALMWHDPDGGTLIGRFSFGLTLAVEHPNTCWILVLESGTCRIGWVSAIFLKRA